MQLELTKAEADALDALLSAKVDGMYLYQSKQRIAAWFDIRAKLRAEMEATCPRLI